jgi:DNA repair photolyase
MTKRISGTREWADGTYNVLSGCGHGCLYCYAKTMAVRFNRKTRDNWTTEEPTKRKPVPNAKRVMFPTTHDITPEHLDLHLDAIDRITKKGNILIVSKPHLECIKAICAQFQDRQDKILFRFTIGSVGDEVLKYWEPNAPGFAERLASLQHAFNEGFQTSVSCEPMLDANIESVVELVHPFVTDAIWIGKMNKAVARVTINTNDPQAAECARHVEASQNEPRIRTIYAKFKDDPKVKWKESIKEVLGLELAQEEGLDV